MHIFGKSYSAGEASTFFKHRTVAVLTYCICCLSILCFSCLNKKKGKSAAQCQSKRTKIATTTVPVTKINNEHIHCSLSQQIKKACAPSKSERWFQLCSQCMLFATSNTACYTYVLKFLFTCSH